MTPETHSALLLLGAGWLQSFVYVVGKLPPAKRPPGFPESPSLLGLLNLIWMALFCWGISQAFQIEIWLGIVAVPLYFGVLPFVYQLPLVKLFGYRNFRQFMDAVDGLDSDTPQTS